MARPLLSALSDLPVQQLRFLPAPIAFMIILAAVFSVFSAVTFMCGSHSGWTRSLTRNGKKAVRLGGDGNKPRMVEKMKSSLSSKALLMAKMISWRKVQDDGEAEDYTFMKEEEEFEDDAVWKKEIIRGEKCRPIDFSGKILYDCDGNRLPD